MRLLRRSFFTSRNDKYSFFPKKRTFDTAPYYGFYSMPLPKGRFFIKVILFRSLREETLRRLGTFARLLFLFPHNVVPDGEILQQIVDLLLNRFLLITGNGNFSYRAVNRMWPDFDF